jgi:hypothetical protein
MKKALSKLQAWLAQRSFTLRLVGAKAPSEMVHATREVRVSCRGSDGHVLAVALHECGHVLVHLQRRRRKDLAVAGRAWVDKDSDVLGRRRFTRTVGIQRLQEEYAAWERGARLAQRLGLRVPSKAFERAATQGLLSHAQELVLPPPPPPVASKPTASVKCSGDRKSS